MSLTGNVEGKTLVGSINRCDLLTISAYGVAVKNGFEGTEEEWLASLKAYIPGTGKNAEVFNGGDPENASGEEGHAEGHNTKSTYARGHAEGDCTEAGWRSHAGGFYSLADAASYAGGRLTRATDTACFAHGLELSEQPTISGSKLVTTKQLTMHSTEIPVNVSVTGTIKVGDFICINLPNGNSTDCRKVVTITPDGKTMTLDYPFYEPLQPSYSGIDQDSVVFPAGTVVRLASLCEATNDGAVAVGCATKATGKRAFAHGEKSIASGEYSEAGGRACEASGARARASGTNSKATGTNSVAEGDTATASATCAVATGRNTVASGDYSNAGGFKCEATGTCSSASGNQTKASGNGAVATGSRTVAKGDYQTVCGRSNIVDENNKYAEIVGIGSSGSERNGRTTDWNGNGWYAGNLQAQSVEALDGFVLMDAYGSRWKIIIDTDGNLQTYRI